MEEEFPFFEGTIEKIIIESEAGGFCPPTPGQEIRQRLTMRKNGKVAFTRYFSGDFSKVPPTADSKVMRRYNCMPTEKLMEYISFYFGRPCITEVVRDAGIWEIELINTEGKKFTYVGSLGSEIEIRGFNISQIARRVLEIDELWMFDGGVSKLDVEGDF